MDIYIKPKKKVLITKRKIVYTKDICDIFINDNNMRNNIENIIITKINSDIDCEIVISVIDIIKKISISIDNATISNLGEMDTLVQYKINDINTSKFKQTLKVIFVSCVLFAGASTTIISFHSDAQMPRVFGNFYNMFFGEYNENAPIIAIPYTIGLGIGIIVFFNHFSKKYITKDPTPIEVQMTTYEKETVDSIIAKLEKSESNDQ